MKDFKFMLVLILLATVLVGCSARQEAVTQDQGSVNANLKPSAEMAQKVRAAKLSHQK